MTNENQAKMTESDQGKSPTEAEADQKMREVSRKFPSLISDVDMKLTIVWMLSSVMFIDKDFRKKEPEGYYGLKSRVRDFIPSLEKAIVDLNKVLDEATKAETSGS